MNISETLDVVYLIFQRADKPSLAACARVCRGWSDMALDSLWSNLDTVVPLLHLISPMEIFDTTSGEKGWRFQNPDFEADFHNTDWERFNMYARRVRVLSNSKEDRFKTREVWSGDILSVRPCDLHLAAFLHPFGSCVVPNLENLRWVVESDDDALSFLMFLSPNLDSLALRLERITAATGHRIFRALRCRFQSLRRFTLITDLYPDDLDSAIASWLPMNPSLQYVLFPRFYQTALIAGALQKLPALRTIDMAYNTLYPIYSDDGVRLFHEDAEFPSLREAVWNVNIASALTTKFGSALSRLEALTINDSALTSTEDLRDFLTMVSLNCRSLKRLGLQFAGMEQTSIAIGWNDIQCLTSCTGLLTLRIWNDHPIHLLPEHVGYMGAAWPHLENLQICSDPHCARQEYDEAITDISIVGVFAAHMPHLISLEPLVSFPEVLDFNGNLEPKLQFSSIRTLGFGLSRIRRRAVVTAGAYLASLCPGGATITFKPSPEYEDSYATDESAREEIWKQLKEVFDMSSRSKQYQRQQQRRHLRLLDGNT